MKNRLGVFLELILMFCAPSCMPRQLSIAGSYSWKDPLNLSSSQLTINQDSTFQYWFQAGDLYGISSNGRWRYFRETRRLLLNSQIQSMNDLIRVEESIDKELPPRATRISIFGPDNQPELGYIIVNPTSHSELKFTANDEVSKSVILNDKEIKEIALNYFDLGSTAIFDTIRNPSANDIKIHIQTEPYRAYRFFRGQLWRVKSNKLMEPDTAFNHVKVRVYLKSSAKIAADTQATCGLPLGLSPIISSRFFGFCEKL